MSKAMLIMNMPECCARCNLCVLHSDYVSIEYECRGTKFYNGYVKVHPRIDRKLLNKRQDWCPLREVPRKIGYAKWIDDLFIAYADGYNACLDEILGN